MTYAYVVSTYRRRADYDLWTATTFPATTFDFAARSAAGLTRLPTLQEWLAGGSIPAGPTGDWNLGSVQSSPGTAYDYDYEGFSYGFGYEGAGGC